MELEIEPCELPEPPPRKVTGATAVAAMRELYVRQECRHAAQRAKHAALRADVDAKLDALVAALIDRPDLAEWLEASRHGATFLATLLPLLVRLDDPGVTYAAINLFEAMGRCAGKD